MSSSRISLCLKNYYFLFFNLFKVLLNWIPFPTVISLNFLQHMQPEVHIKSMFMKIGFIIVAIELNNKFPATWHFLLIYFFFNCYIWYVFSWNLQHFYKVSFCILNMSPFRFIWSSPYKCQVTWILKKIKLVKL